MRSKEQTEILYTFNLPSDSENEITINIYEPVLFAAEIILPVEFEGLPEGENGIFNKPLNVENLRYFVSDTRRHRSINLFSPNFLL